MSDRKELENFAIVEILDYYKNRDKYRQLEKEKTVELADDFTDAMDKSLRGEIDSSEIEKYFAQGLINTAADPTGSDSLNKAIQRYVSQQFFRVNHPGYNKLNKVNVKLRLFDAIGKSAQVEKAVEIERSVAIGHKIKVQPKVGFFSKIRSFLGMDRKEETKKLPWGA